jgi:hypothetical protein
MDCSDLCVNFLISIRDDDVEKLGLFKGRILNLFDNYLRIEYFDYEAAREAVTKPIEHYNKYVTHEQQINIESALVEAILDQVKTEQVPLGGAERDVTGGGMISTSMARVEVPYL